MFIQTFGAVMNAMSHPVLDAFLITCEQIDTRNKIDEAAWGTFVMWDQFESENSGADHARDAKF